MEKEYYIKKWLKGDLTPEEQKIFEQSGDYKTLKKLSKSMMAFKAPQYDTEEALEEMMDKIRMSQTTKTKRRWLTTSLQVAAAVSFFVVAFFYFFHHKDTVIKTSVAQNTSIFLPDSSEVLLNAETRIAYNKQKWHKKRSISMEGEAFFTVAKGSRFDVESPLGKVSVVGTRFNVISRENYFEVACYRGKVQVENTNIHELLTPGHTIRMLNGNISRLNNSAAEKPEWLTESIFTSVPLSVVLREFERQYDVRIISKNIKPNQLFTGRFVHDNRSLAIKSIAIPFNLTIKDEGKQIILMPKGE